MSHSASPLSALFEAEFLQRTQAAELPWNDDDARIVRALCFVRTYPDRPRLIGLLGGASCGKSTIFNAMLDRVVSRVSPHAHETIGPVIAGGDAATAFLTQAHTDGLFLSEMELDHDQGDAPPDAPSPARGDDHFAHTGRIGAAVLSRVAALADGLVLIDLPDVTSRSSADEGHAAEAVIPWLDGLIVVLDEERRFDAAVRQIQSRAVKQCGCRVFCVFNHTSPDIAPPVEDQGQLTELARSGGADGAIVLPFTPGGAVKSFGDATRPLHNWIDTLATGARAAALATETRRRCNRLLEVNTRRAAQREQLSREVMREVQSMQDRAQLTYDLLSEDERQRLGKLRQMVPMFDWLNEGRRKIGRLLGATEANDLRKSTEKSADELAGELSHNFESRVQNAFNRIRQVVATSEYFDADARWEPQWSDPPFEAKQWAERIRGHIKAWTQERDKHVREGDRAALLLGVPLIVADILVLGGAGLTLSWTAAAISGFALGKGAVSAVRTSPAYRDYETTAREYQSFLREVVGEQWRENEERMPRRHIPATDPIMGAIRTGAIETGAGA